MGCERCSTEISGKHVRFCDPCRAQVRRRPPKWIATPRIDVAISQIYLEHPQAKTHPGVAALAARIRWPKWAVCRRARQLGLARAKEKRWSDEELAILEKVAWMGDTGIALKLKAAGFVRTATAIHLKVKRMRFKQNTPFYSATGLASAFGIDAHAITRWIRQGKLSAKRRETDRTDSQGGDPFMIHENEARKFILENPMDFDLRKVDQLWFMDLMTNGK